MNKFWLKSVFLLAYTSLLISAACFKEEIETIATSEEKGQLPEKIAAKIEDLQLNSDAFEIRTISDMTGTSKELLVMGDAIINQADFLAISKPTLTKQYNTGYLVDTELHPTITIYVNNNGGTHHLSPKAQQGVRDAVANWNGVIGSSIQLNIAYSSDTDFDPAIHDIEVLVIPFPGFGIGAAQFPTNDGKPGGLIILNAAYNNDTLSSNALAHGFSHEIGTTLGLANSDWNTRQSCVNAGILDEPSSETDFGVEAPILIVGTLPNIPGIIEQEDSVMNSCFDFENTTGKLNFFDEQALRMLYPQ